MYFTNYWSKDQDQTSACVSINISSDQSHQTSGEQLHPITDVLRSPPVTNEVAMELRLLAEVANGIMGTGQVCRAGGNLTPPNGAVGRKERVCPGLCVFVHVCFCKKDEGQSLKLRAAKINTFTPLTLEFLIESWSRC